jgi:AcrR family transcriptional regulator
VSGVTKPRGKPVSRPARTREAAPEASTRTAVPFAEILRRQQREAGKRRKGERTRDRLKLAAVQVLEERGFLNLRVTDICKRAKVSPAAFYLYFNNKQEVTVEVLTEFLHQTFKLTGSEGSARPLFESIYDANLIWASSVRANAGLMRCLLQLGDQVPEFKRLNSRLNHEWFVYVTDRLLRRFPKTRIDDKSLLLAVYALGGMMDELSSKVLVAREEYLQPVIEAVAPTDEALAEFLSVLWYRALFGSEPTRLRYPSSRELLKLSDIDRPDK